jgi:hypothetical protein
MSIFSGARLQEIGLSIKTISATSEELIEAIYAIDMCILDEDTLSKLMRAYPNPDEEK